MKNLNRKITELTVAEFERMIGAVIRGNLIAYLKPCEEQDTVSIEVAGTITNLKRQSIYNKVHSRTIPFIKKEGSKKLNFSRKALLLWMTEGGTTK